jgi:hypothetical protein
MRKLGEKVILEQAPRDVDQQHVELWVERGLAIVCHLSIAAGLVLIGWRHFEDLQTGMSAATFYLLLPYTFLLLPKTALGVGRWDHAWPMAVIVWAVFCYRRPTVVGLLLGVAAGTVFFPALLFPLLWSFYRRRGGLRFAVAFVLSATLCLLVISSVLWFNNLLPNNWLFGWKLSAWLPWQRPDADMRGVWQGTTSHWAYRLPISLVYLAFLGTTAFWPSPKNLAHVIALIAALLLGVQFWYADMGGIYILWYLPLLLLLAFRPNLSACQPQPPGDDGLARWGRRLARSSRRLLRWFLPGHPSRQTARMIS